MSIRSSLVYEGSFRLPPREMAVQTNEVIEQNHSTANLRGMEIPGNPLVRRVSRETVISTHPTSLPLTEDHSAQLIRCKLLAAHDIHPSEISSQNV